MLIRDRRAIAGDHGERTRRSTRYERERTEVARAEELERVGHGVAVRGEAVALVDERDAEALVRQRGREAAGARAAVGNKAVHGAVAGTEYGRGRRE